MIADIRQNIIIPIRTLIAGKTVSRAISGLSMMTADASEVLEADENRPA
jgi:hypothetical protein